MSTRLSYIHGRSQAIPKGKARPRFVDYSKMTEGELRLSLMAEQLNILAQYYGKDEYKTLEEKVLSAVSTGIHGKAVIQTVSGKRGQIIANEIQKARRMTRPASGKFSKSRNLNVGVNGLIDLENCDDLQEFIEDDYGLGWGTWEETPESIECRERNETLAFLNEHLEGSAHHLLYEYLDNVSEPTPAAKKVLHRIAVSELAQISEVSRDNLRLWLRNGVMRNNVNYGTDPLQPEDTIATLAASASSSYNTASNTESAVGEILLAGIAAIISAIAGAAVVTINMIHEMKMQKQQQLQNAAQGIGNMSFGPEQMDWPSDGSFPIITTPNSTGSSIISNDNLPYLLMGGAALLLFND